MKILIVSAIVSALLLAPAYAQITVEDAWIRATVPQQKVTGAFMQLNAVQDSRLVEVRSPVAKTVEIHEMSMDKDVMKMRAVTGIDLPAGKPVELKPGGFHIMLMGLTQQMKEGARVPLTLIVESKDKKRSSVEIKVPVRPLAAASGGVSQHKH